VRGSTGHLCVGVILFCCLDLIGPRTGITHFYGDLRLFARSNLRTYVAASKKPKFRNQRWCVRHDRMTRHLRNISGFTTYRLPAVLPFPAAEQVPRGTYI
jgi:hypothetical protein